MSMSFIENDCEQTQNTLSGELKWGHNRRAVEDVLGAEAAGAPFGHVQSVEAEADQAPEDCRDGEGAFQRARGAEPGQSANVGCGEGRAQDYRDEHHLVEVAAHPVVVTRLYA